MGQRNAARRQSLLDAHLLLLPAHVRKAYHAADTNKVAAAAAVLGVKPFRLDLTGQGGSAGGSSAMALDDEEEEEEEAEPEVPGQRGRLVSAAPARSEPSGEPAPSEEQGPALRHTLAQVPAGETAQI